MKTSIFSLLRLLMMASCLVFPATDRLHAAQQYQGLCSYVKMEILQELALERIGFLATLEVTNNEGDASITDFSAVLTFEQQALSPGEETSEASDLFFVQPPELEGISAIDGTGIIRPGETAIIRWFIIPKITAGGTDPIGLQYLVGAELGGSIYGLQIAPEILAVIPDTITVKPEPQLEITYFQPRDVDGDDPFTPDVVETPVPFTLGVLVNNVGYGRAESVRVESEQPRIVENLQGLQVIPRLLGARVDDEPTDHTSLTLVLGDIEPGMCRKGAWDMITTLSGEFTQFDASYTHASELGGRDTSVITSLEAYFMVHEVMNDQPGRDGLLDFLADTVDDGEMMPDLLYESDCVTTPVNRLTETELLDYTDLVATVSVNATFENWVYMRLDDPAQAKYPISSVVRSDGKVLNPHNYWTNIRYREPDNAKLTYLNIFDFVSLGTYEYTITYEPPDSDVDPPVTNVIFSGQYEKRDDKYYVLPETQIFFLAEDDSPVATYYQLDAGDYVPAVPFSIAGGGEHILTYYSEDCEGNTEAEQSAIVVVSTDYPGVDNLTTDTETVINTGESISIRPTRLAIDFNGVVTAGTLDAGLEVFQGVWAYPTLSGVPASPTATGTATISVGGENVDYYRYRLNGTSWSDEFPVSQPIDLTGLVGTVELTVAGRSEYGAFHADSDAVMVSWTVDMTAPAISITGTPETPTRAVTATLGVGDSPFYCYRIDGSAYHPNAEAGSSIVLTRLNDGEHSVEVLPRENEGDVCPADGAGVTARWTVDHEYGLHFPIEKRVRSESLGQVDGNSTTFVWDGRNDSGTLVQPGWYTIKVTVTDGLGRSNGAIQLVRVGDLVTDGSLLSDPENAGGQKEAHAFGKWAVWQDQRSGSWDIYAVDLTDPSGTPRLVQGTPLNQERPRTDGDYVVWEDRQADGTWDVWAKELGSAEASFPVTATSDMDEKKPVISWPWVVCQIKPVSDPNAPWQLRAYNLISEDSQPVDATAFDQLDPRIHKQRVVWQDFRDAGAGEIYMKELETGNIRRITNNPAGQYYPDIFDQWIVWMDNRHTQLDLYGFNLLRNTEIRLTNTAEDETRPTMNGQWVIFSEDSGGESAMNIRALSLINLAAIQMTNTGSLKEKPCAASGKLLWADSSGGPTRIMIGSMPDLQPVFNNRNAVAVTDGMASTLQDGFTLLELWNREAGITEITRYTSLVPTVSSDTVNWSGGGPVGDNFALEPGTFLWVRFNQPHVLDLGLTACGALDLVPGTNVLTYTCFPDQYSAYELIGEIGTENLDGVRMLDAETGRWRVASAVDGTIVGEDFAIPRIAVVMIEMKTEITAWKPGE